MNAKTRQVVYVVAFTVAVAIAGLVLFGVVDPAQVPIALGVLALVYAGVSALAFVNVKK